GCDQPPRPGAIRCGEGFRPRLLDCITALQRVTAKQGPIDRHDGPRSTMTSARPGAPREEDAAFRGVALEKVYHTGETSVHALRGVDLLIPRGEMLVLLGPSGSGKSTLLNIIGGLDRPTAGTLYYRDTELTALNDRDLTRFRRAEIGFIFQFYNLIPSLTAEE